MADSLPGDTWRENGEQADVEEDGLPIEANHHHVLVEHLQKKCAFWAHFLPVLLALEIVLPVSRSLRDSPGGPHLPKGLGMLIFDQGLSMSVQSNRNQIVYCFFFYIATICKCILLQFALLSIHGPSF